MISINQHAILVFGLVLLFFSGCDHSEDAGPTEPYALSSVGLGSTGYSIQEYNRLAKTLDGGVAVVYHALDPLNSNNGIENLEVRKYSGSGEPQWIYRLKDTYTSIGHSIYSCANGDLIIVGSKAKSNFFSEGADPYLIRLTASGELSWKKSYTALWHDEAISVIETTSGAIVMLVRTLSDDYLLKVDSNGNELWRKPIGHSYCDGYLNLHAVADDGFIASGPSIKQYDSSGEEVWCFYPGSDPNFSPADTWTFQNIVPITSTEVLAFGLTVRGGQIATTCINQLETDYVLVKVNDFGTTLPPTIYTFNYNNYPKSIDQTSDGGYIMVGDAINIQPCDVYDISSSSNLIKVGNNGQMSWNYVLSLGAPIAIKEISPDYYALLTQSYSSSIPGGNRLTIFFFKKLP